MIISRWNGFEIDSSEGYYVFEKESEDVKEGWDFLQKLLSSPLLWHEVSFTLIPIETHKKDVENYLSKKLEQGVIEKFEHEYEDEIEEERKEYDFTDEDEDEGHLPSHIPPEFKTSILSFLDIFNHLKNLLSLISINFCIAPLKSLPKDEYKRLRSWFIRQFDNKEEGESRWRNYCRIKEKDFELLGNTELTNCPEPLDAFEGNFEFYSKKYLSFRLNMPAMDPSLMIYLLLTLVRSFDLKFKGTHYTFDYTPDKLKSLRNDDTFDYSPDKLKLLK